MQTCRSAPISIIRPPETRTSAGYAGPPVPSTTVPPLINKRTSTSNLPWLTDRSTQSTCRIALCDTDCNTMKCARRHAFCGAPEIVFETRSLGKSLGSLPTAHSRNGHHAMILESTPHLRNKIGSTTPRRGRWVPFSNQASTLISRIHQIKILPGPDSRLYRRRRRPASTHESEWHQEQSHRSYLCWYR